MSGADDDVESQGDIIWSYQMLNVCNTKKLIIVKNKINMNLEPKYAKVVTYRFAKFL